MNIIKYIDMSVYFINNLYIIKYRINTKQYDIITVISLRSLFISNH